MPVRTRESFKVAVVKEPVVQNVIWYTASGVEKYCKNVFAALKKKFNARPIRMIFLLLIPDKEERKIRRNMEINEQEKAVIPGLNHKIPIFNSKNIDTAAPKADAADIPRVNGDASELSSITCIIAPAKPRHAPAVIAIKISGRRMFIRT